MNDLFRRFRGLAIAVVVVALSATAALAAAPRLAPTASGSPAANASESAEPSESESPEAADSAEPSESEPPEAADSAEPSESGSPKAADSAEPSQAANAGQQGDHGALVSAAANMNTPAGFANHGAFVSCVAHMDATLATIDWSTVTPASCGQTSQNGASTNGHGHRHGRPSWAGKPTG